MFSKSSKDITYDDIISLENVLEAWEEFLKSKRKRKDVQESQLHLMDNIISLHNDLENKTYRHGDYEAFNISDPKPRNIHKATVRDRLLHHAIHRRLYPFFDQRFIVHSYSCRKNKGTHRALNTFNTFARKVSHNHTKTCWVLKCDIKKFFASIDHEILLRILQKYIYDTDILWLLNEIIESLHTSQGTGLLLGNLTSQLLVNIYMNEFDQYMKHKIKAKYYIRYADDFVIFNQDKERLAKILQSIGVFLQEKLQLELHPNKVSITTLVSGIDFLGWVHFPHHRVLRTTTKRRMYRNIRAIDAKPETVQSYLGMLSHGDTWKLREEVSRRRPKTPYM